MRLKGTGLTFWLHISWPSFLGGWGVVGAGPSVGSSPTSAPLSTWPSLWAKGKTDFLPAGSQHCFSSSV